MMKMMKYIVTFQNIVPDQYQASPESAPYLEIFSVYICNCSEFKCALFQ